MFFVFSEWNALLTKGIGSSDIYMQTVLTFVSAIVVNKDEDNSQHVNTVDNITASMGKGIAGWKIIHFL